MLLYWQTKNIVSQEKHTMSTGFKFGVGDGVRENIGQTLHQMFSDSEFYCHGMCVLLGLFQKLNEVT